MSVLPMAEALVIEQIQKEAVPRQQQGGGVILDTHRDKMKAAVVDIIRPGEAGLSTYQRA